jgi:hypothetical protein
MSVARVNLWVPDFRDTCQIDNVNHFVATVQNCEGRVLEWSGGRYWTKDGSWHQIVGDSHGARAGVAGYYDGVPGTGDPGHVSFEVPPGCYIVSASTHVWVQQTGTGKLQLLGNLGTQHAMIKVCCGEEVCVTVFQPTGFHCSVIEVQELLLPFMEAQKIGDVQLVQNARKALQALTAQLQPSAFDQNNLEIARTIVKRLTTEKPQQPPAR